MVTCGNCGSDIGKGWRYCPKCGATTGESDLFSAAFSGIFERMAEEFSEMDKMFEKQAEVIDISPWFKKPKGIGFSIKIVSGTGMEPRIEVHGFGGADENKLKKQLYSQLGIRGKPKIAKERIDRSKPMPTPKITEEPKTNIKRVDGKVSVDLELPGIKNADNIEIRELGNSVEVKAIVGDKAFFKILTKPENNKIRGRKFEKGILHLEFS